MEENQTKKAKFQNMNFFKMMWYSITKFEKYPEMAAAGLKKAIIYFTELMIIFSIIYTGTYVYYISNLSDFDEQDLTLSEKIVNILMDDEEYEDEELQAAASLLSEYSDSYIIASLFISFFVSFYITIILDVLTLSIFGLLTCLVAKIKINYKAIFNMSIYALTLSIILRIIYSVVYMLADFEIKYFDIMYIAVSYISLAAAIFLIKSDVIKQHLELKRILEESKEKIEETITIPKKPEEEEKKEKEEEQNNKTDDKKEKGEEEETEGQGSNA